MHMNFRLGKNTFNSFEIVFLNIAVDCITPSVVLISAWQSCDKDQKTV